MHVIEHPLVQARLTCLRDRQTASWDFRRNLHELSQILLMEATRDLEVTPTRVVSPLAETDGCEIARPIVLVPILRAGLGMLNGMMEILTEAQVGHIGMVRDEGTAESNQYFCKLPGAIENAVVILLDPMLATGGSAVQAADALKASGARQLRFVSIIAAPEGVAAFEAAHPDVPAFTAAIDQGLNESAFIVPGLGDAGDRYFGTDIDHIPRRH